MSWFIASLSYANPLCHDKAVEGASVECSKIMHGSNIYWKGKTDWCILIFVVVQSLSCVHAVCVPMDCSTPGFPVLHYLLSLLKLVSIKLVMSSNHLILCCPLLLLPSIFPSIRVFLMSWHSTSSGQSIGASASASVLPMNIHDWFHLGLTSLISLQSKGLSRVFYSTTISKHQFFALRLLYGPTVKSVHDYWKNITVTIQTFVSKVMSLLFNMLSIMGYKTKNKSKARQEKAKRNM